MLRAQKNEITGSVIYARLADKIKDPSNSALLKRISEEEASHYRFWASRTGVEVKPSMIKVFRFFWLSRILGLTFGVKLLERDEDKAQIDYDSLAEFIPGVKAIAEDEEKHEKELIEMIEEERLQYAGSVVLGLNDALVELTGALAGLTLAFANTRMIALAGLVTGIAASLSMAASEYLSTKAEDGGTNPLKSSLYTGTAYIVTVAILIFPYLVFSNYLVCLGITMFNAILIIFLFNYYISVAKDLNFKKRFAEMSLISIGVAAVSFGIGVVIKKFIGIEI